MPSTADVMIPLEEKKTAEKFENEEKGYGDLVHCKKFGQILATVIVCIGSMSCGSMLSWSSPCLSELEALKLITGDQASWAASLLPFGAFLAAPPAGKAADKFGRKPALLFTTIPMLASWIMLIFVRNIWLLYIARLLAGAATGFICVLAPMYISEISHPTLRGPLGTQFALFLCTGITLTFIFATFAEYTLLTILMACFPPLYLLGMIFMPETPKYLLRVGREKAAKKSLEFFRGKNYNFQAEMSEILRDLEVFSKEEVGWREILKKKIYRKSLIACLVLFFYQQLSGINAVIFYTVPIFNAAESNMDPIISSIVVSSIQVFTTILFVFVVDKQGRKNFLLQTTVVNAFSLFILGLYFNLVHLNVDIPYMNIIPLASLMLFIFSFSLALGPIPWILLGEILAPEIIGIVGGAAVMCNWFSCFVVTKSFGPMMSGLGPYITFYFFAIFNTLATLSIYFLVPETRGKNLQDVQAELDK